MAIPPPSNEQLSDASVTTVAIAASEHFNPLTDDLKDLRLTHEQCWLWPQLTFEIDRLDAILDDARIFLEPLVTADYPEWAQQAAIGIVRSNVAIHQYAERYSSYVDAARSLWTTRIPSTPPTLSDAQIYAMIAMHEARMAAETYCEIATGLEEEMEQTGIGHDDEDEISWLRGELAGWERTLWRDAAQRAGTAEKFLLMADFAASAPDPTLFKKAESQIAKLRRRANAAEAAAEPYRQGRQPGAVSLLTKALMAIVEDVGSRDPDRVIPAIQMACDDIPIEGIQFQDYNDDFIWYADVIRNKESKIRIDSLKRKLAQLPDV